MRSDRLSLAVATLFLAGLSFSSLESAWSEPKPTAAPTVQQSVQVGQPGGAPAGGPATAPSGSPKGSGDLIGGPPAKRVLKRNPFVPPGAGAVTTTGPSSGVKPQVTPSPGRTKEPTAAPTPALPPPKPTFTLAGIFSSRGFPTALLMTSKGPIEAQVGSVVDGYKVTSINLNTRQVIVQMRAQAFSVSLPKDKPYGGNGPDSGTGSGDAGPAGAPPSGGAPAGPPPSGGEPPSGPPPPKGGKRNGGGGGNAPLPPPPPAAPQGGGQKGGH